MSVSQRETSGVSSEEKPGGVAVMRRAAQWDERCCWQWGSSKSSSDDTGVTFADQEFYARQDTKYFIYFFQSSLSPSPEYSSFRPSYR